VILYIEIDQILQKYQLLIYTSLSPVLQMHSSIHIQDCGKTLQLIKGAATNYGLSFVVFVTESLLEQTVKRKSIKIERPVIKRMRVSQLLNVGIGIVSTHAVKTFGEINS
jgi:hypothetical protein